MVAVKWFEINEMKLNAEKFHLFISGNKFQQIWVRIIDDRYREKELFRNHD